MKFNETQFKAMARPHILNCRPGDWKHAQHVVEWVKKLGYNSSHLNELIMAAYIHDIGWRNVLPSQQKLSKEQLLKFEPTANKNSKAYVNDFLSNISLSISQIHSIQRFITAADKHQSSNQDEAIIVDADNLSKLNIHHLKEKYKPSSWMDWYRKWSDTFPQRIQTTAGKKIYPRLLEDLKKSIQQELNHD